MWWFNALVRLGPKVWEDSQQNFVPSVIDIWSREGQRSQLAENEWAHEGDLNGALGSGLDQRQPGGHLGSEATDERSLCVSLVPSANLPFK